MIIQAFNVPILLFVQPDQASRRSVGPTGTRESRRPQTTYLHQSHNLYWRKYAPRPSNDRLGFDVELDLLDHRTGKRYPRRRQPTCWSQDPGRQQPPNLPTSSNPISVRDYYNEESLLHHDLIGADKRNCDMILGLPWLREFNPGINWAEDFFAFRAGGKGSFDVPIRAKELKGSEPAPTPEAAAIPQSFEDEEHAESKQKGHVEDSTRKVHDPNPDHEDHDADRPPDIAVVGAEEFCGIVDTGRGSGLFC